MTAELLSSTRGQTLVLTLSNPGLHNALDPAMYAAGIEVLNGSESHADVRSVVLTGAGALFSAGGNLRRLQATRARGLAGQEEQAQSIDGLHGWIEALRAYPKPVIAAVEGAAAGSAFSVALACDLIVAARDAVFSLACSRAALSPEGGASWSLAQMLPRQLAAELLLCGEPIGAERLHALGVVNRLADSGQALAAALALADTLNSRSPHALASAKELLSDAPGRTLAEQLAAERTHLLRNLFHANAGEGVEPLLEKHPPHY